MELVEGSLGIIGLDSAIILSLIPKCILAVCRIVCGMYLVIPFVVPSIVLSTANWNMR